MIYPAGTYGTYLEWLLNTLRSPADIQSPFTKNGPTIGNSHGSRMGHQLLDMQGWRSYQKKSLEFETVRLHPKTQQSENMSDNLGEILQGCARGILIYPSRGHELLCINNWLTKVYNNPDVLQGSLRDIDIEVIKQKWPVAPQSRTIPRWILREYLSYYLVPAWFDQVEWFFPDQWQNDRCVIIQTNELLNDIVTTVEKIKHFWGVEFLRSIDDLLPYHDEMLRLQPHLYQDTLCQQIVQSILNPRSFFEWPALTIGNESWLQWKLRNMGYSIRCHELDEFPNNNQSLLDLIYRE